MRRRRCSTVDSRTTGSVAQGVLAHGSGQRRPRRAGQGRSRAPRWPSSRTGWRRYFWPRSRPAARLGHLGERLIIAIALLKRRLHRIAHGVGHRIEHAAVVFPLEPSARRHPHRLDDSTPRSCVDSRRDLHARRIRRASGAPRGGARRGRRRCRRCSGIPRAPDPRVVCPRAVTSIWSPSSQIKMCLSARPIDAARSAWWTKWRYSPCTGTKFLGRSSWWNVRNSPWRA